MTDFSLLYASSYRTHVRYRMKTIFSIVFMRFLSSFDMTMAFIPFQSNLQRFYRDTNINNMFLFRVSRMIIVI